MATPDGQASRNSGALHRKMRSRRPVHSLDEPGLGSPPETPTGHGARGQEGRHRRSAAMLQRVLRKVVLETNPQNAGRMGEFWTWQQQKQRAAVSSFGNTPKTALQPTAPFTSVVTTHIL